jgi:hypothetical protein
MPLQILSAGSGIQHPLRHYDNPHGLYPLPAFACLSSDWPAADEHVPNVMIRDPPLPTCKRLSPRGGIDAPVAVLVWRYAAVQQVMGFRDRCQNHFTRSRARADYCSAVRCLRRVTWRRRGRLEALRELSQLRPEPAALLRELAPLEGEGERALLGLGERRALLLEAGEPVAGVLVAALLLACEGAGQGLALGIALGERAGEPRGLGLGLGERCPPLLVLGLGLAHVLLQELRAGGSDLPVHLQACDARLRVLQRGPGERSLALGKLRGLTINGTKTYAKGQPSSSSGRRSGRMPPLATCGDSENEYRPRTFT